MPIPTKIEEITKIRGLSKDSFGGLFFIVKKNEDEQVSLCFQKKYLIMKSGQSKNT